ncbi:low molecular weight protein-tyrosine-phosphatase [Rhodanobacter aciditrophus]|uniref:protein-tyrosine-phosphatase n=1 Tax=Rhodanobacter aciditrophus TaxID=1623218 RepID=A0ABW4B2M2_9GAMM
MKVLTVCLGNICRSPAAQGILEAMASQRGLTLSVASAGTAAYHIGKAPDPRSQRALSDIGIDISSQRARQVTKSDFDEFDWILAMDAQNYANLKRLAPKNHTAKVVMFGSFAADRHYGEVDDPYYDGDEGFQRMREHLLEISKDFVEHLSAQ